MTVLRRLLPTALFVLLAVSAALAADVAVKTKRGIVVKGRLGSCTDQGVVILVGSKELTFKWSDLAPKSVYDIRSKTLGENDAAGHFKLGTFCLEAGMKFEAEREFDKAVKADETYKAKVEQALAEREKRLKAAKPGPASAPPAMQAKGDEPPAKPASPPPAQPPAKAAEKPAPGDGNLPDITLDSEDVRPLVVQAQREYLQTISDYLKTPFCTVETEHYILHSTFNPAVTKKISNGCEDLYRRMSNVFGLKKGDKLWTGKCMIVLFEDRNDFVKYAERIDGYKGAGSAGGYFSPTAGFAEIVIPKTAYGDSAKSFESTLIHEGGHAFLRFFRSRVNPSVWIHEGVAQYFEQERFKDSYQWSYMKSKAKENADPDFARHNRLKKVYAGSDIQAYAYAWSAITFLIKVSPKKFREFIFAIKDGMSESSAMRKAYGWDMDEFDKKWAYFVEHKWK